MLGWLTRRFRRSNGSDLKGAFAGVVVCACDEDDLFSTDARWNIG